MKNINWVRKLTSRKLWLSIASFAGMMITATGGTDNHAAQVTAIIMAGATVIGYVIGEGLTDAVNKSVDKDNVKDIMIEAAADIIQEESEE